MSLLQEMETHGLADCEFNRKLPLIDLLVEHDLECFYNRSFKQQEQALANMFYENYRTYDQKDLSDLYFDLTGKEYTKWK